MSSHGEHSHPVRRVVLPSGRTLEVVDSKAADPPVPATEAEPASPDHERLMRHTMAEEIDRFVRALAADAILPEDF